MANFSESVANVHESDSSDLSMHRIFSSSMAENQLFKGQDQVHQFEYVDALTSQKVNVYINFDGHGTDHFIRAVRNAIADGNLNKLLMEERPIEAISSYFYDLKVVPTATSSGAVVTLAKIFFEGETPIKIQFHNCGDAQSAFYVDGVLKYINTPHDLDNPSEVEKVKTNPNFLYEKKDGGIKILTPSNITAAFPKFCVYKDRWNEKTLAPTRAIGHTKICCDEAEVHEEFLKPGEKYRVVLGTDGIFDMALLNDPSDHAILTIGSAQDIVQFYTSRWLQPWFHMETAESIESCGTIQYKANQADDVSSIVIDISY